jgi:tetratricopeptide (TPR) repeat protein
MPQLRRYLFAALLVVATGCQTGASSQEYISDAQRAAEAGRFQQAETLMGRAVDKGTNPNDFRLRDIRATIVRGNASDAATAGDSEKAISLYKKAAQMESDDVQAARDYVQIAELRLKLNHPPGKVAPVAEQAIERNPASRQAHRLAGRLWDRAGKARKAIDHYLWAFEADRSDTQIGVRLGSLYRQTDQPEDAVTVFERVIKHAPKHVQARVNLAELYEQTGAVDRADTQFETLLEYHPNSAGILRRYAQFLHRHGHAQRAQSMMKRARDAMPGVERREMRELE